MFIGCNKTKTISTIVIALLIGTFITFCIPIAQVRALSAEILKPTSYTNSQKGINQNPEYAYDGSGGGESTTYNNIGVSSNNGDPTITYHTWQNPTETHTARRLYIQRSGSGNSNDTWGIYYSTNGGSGYTPIETGLTNPSLGNTTAVTIDTGLDLSNLVVKIATLKSAGPDNGYAEIYDVWLEGDYPEAPKVGTQIGGGYPIVVNPSSITPQEEWTTVTIPVQAGSTISEIDEVVVKLFYDSVGNDPDESGFSADAQTCAVLTWTRGGAPEWDLTPASTTWAINASGSSKPDDALAQGNWVFSIKVGKVATCSPGSDNWDVYAQAINSSLLTGEDYLRDVEMNWYGEVSVNTVDVTWGSVTPGADFSDSTKQTGISVTYISNGNYLQKTSAASTWTSGSGNAALNVGGSPGARELSIKVNDIDDLPTSALCTAYPTYTTIDDTGTQTDEAGDTVTTNTLWLKLGALPEDTFSGTIYSMITDSP